MTATADSPINQSTEPYQAQPAARARAGGVPAAAYADARFSIESDARDRAGRLWQDDAAERLAGHPPAAQCLVIPRRARQRPGRVCILPGCSRAHAVSRRLRRDAGIDQRHDAAASRRDQPEPVERTCCHPAGVRAGAGRLSRHPRARNSRSNDRADAASTARPAPDFCRPQRSGAAVGQPARARARRRAARGGSALFARRNGQLPAREHAAGSGRSDRRPS